MNNQEQMKFVYQALINGWQVKYLGNETFEFKKRKNKITQNIMLNNDIQRVLCVSDPVPEKNTKMAKIPKTAKKDKKILTK